MIKNVRINSLYSKNILEYCKNSTQQYIKNLIEKNKNEKKNIDVENLFNTHNKNNPNNNNIIIILKVLSISCLLFYYKKKIARLFS
jgi:hypothetical protein